MWTNVCSNVKKVEDEYWEKDSLIEDAMEEFVVQLSESDMDSNVDNEADCDSDALSDDEHDRALQIHVEEQILGDTLAQEEQTLRNIL